MQNVYHTTLSKNGRIVLPAEFREENNLKPGDKLIWMRDGKRWRVTTLMMELAIIQAEAKKLVPPGVSLVDELIAERRENARKEHE